MKLILFFCGIIFVFESWSATKRDSAKTEVDRKPASSDFGRRFIISCPICAGQLGVCTPNPDNLDATAHSPLDRTSINIKDAWLGPGSRLKARGGVKFLEQTDGFRLNENTPECYYEQNVRYRLNDDIMSRYSCTSHKESEVFICDRMVD